MLSEQLNSLNKGYLNEKIYLTISKEMRGLCYKIYKTRYKTNLTTNLGKIRLDIFIILEKLNIYLKELFFNKSYNIEFPLELRVFFGEFKILIDSIIKEIDTE